MVLKRKFNKRVRIQPLVPDCIICGNPVKNHHFLCDKCWGFKAKQKHIQKIKTLSKTVSKSLKYSFNIVSKNPEGFVHILDSIMKYEKEYEYNIQINVSGKLLIDKLAKEYKKENEKKL